jgi:preprotein translocase subunit SecG
MYSTAILVFHICIAVLLIGIVLLQQGKGADAGATFGGGGGNTLFGAGGAETFLTKATTTLAFLFMTTAFTLAVQSNSATASRSEGRLFQGAPEVAEQQTTAPATTTTPAEERTETTETPAER